MNRLLSALAASALLASGAAIHEVNCLRKHLSAIKGGQLARAVQPARLVALVLSDVVGSPLDVIASGPTAPISMVSTHPMPGSCCPCCGTTPQVGLWPHTPQ